MIKEICNCRLQVADYGYYECDLKKGHKGKHRVKIKDEFNDYTIYWKADKYKDLILDLNWIKSNSNLMQVLDDMLSVFPFLNNYELKTGFNGPMYGKNFSFQAVFTIKEDVMKILGDELAHDILMITDSTISPIPYNETFLYKFLVDNIDKDENFKNFKEDIENCEYNLFVGDILNSYFFKNFNLDINKYSLKFSLYANF